MNTIDSKTRQHLIALVKKQVVPAIGCTEPICVALATARATETLRRDCADPMLIPHRIDVRLSANILKNAMGVGIPGTGMSGLPIAIALGALIGKSEYGLEVLRESNPEAVERGCQYIDEGRIDIRLATPEDFRRCDVACDEKLFVDVCVSDACGHSASASIAHEHTNISVVDLYNFCYNLIKKISVMGNDKYRTFIIHQIILQPGNGIHIQMIGRFVQKNDIRIR